MVFENNQNKLCDPGSTILFFVSSYLNCIWLGYITNNNKLSLIGFAVCEGDLEDVSSHANLDAVSNDFLSADVRKRFEDVIAKPEEIESKDYKNAYLYLKRNVKFDSQVSNTTSL